MKIKSQAKSVFSTAGQLGLLVTFFVLAGFMLPMYLAPQLAAWLPITSPQEAARQTMSVRLENRNVSHGETFTIGVSAPGTAVRISSFSYSCDFSYITLAYIGASDIKKIPCDVAVELPVAPRYEFVVFTARNEVTHLPLELTLENDTQIGQISVMVVAARTAANAKSSLADTSSATLRSLPANK